MVAKQSFFGVSAGSQSRRPVSFLVILCCIAGAIYQWTVSRVSIPTGKTTNVVVSSISNASTAAYPPNVSSRMIHHHHYDDESRRKTNLEVLEWILQTNMSYKMYRDEIVSQLPWTMPRPKRPETVQIYNATTWQELRRKLQISDSTAAAAPNQTFTVVISGGSTSAGASSSGERYYLDFMDYMQSMGLISSATRNNIRFRNRAHGSRGSIHSALMRHNFFPPNVDLVIWEFAINDMIVKSDFNKDPVKDAQAARRSLEMWLDAIAEISPRPPHVILMYLWDTHFGVTMNTTVAQLVYESHQFFAARYPFVVGHVNMAHFVEELEWGHEWCKHVLVRDDHHPIWFGHAIMGYLLFDFMIPYPDRLQRAVDQAEALQRKAASLKSDFGCDSTYKAFSDVIDQSRVSIADWTAEIPRNTRINPGMLLLEHASFNVSLGKQDPTRMDRQRAVGLPCCHLSEMVTLRLPQLDAGTRKVIDGTIPMQVHAIYAMIIIHGVKTSKNTDFSFVGVMMDGEEDVAKYQVTHKDPEKKFCWKRNPVDGHWLVLPEPRRVHKIGLCSKMKESCGKPGKGSLIMQSLSVWK